MWLIHEISSLNLHPDGTTASSVFLHLYSHLRLQKFCKSDMWLYYEVANFVTADLSMVRTHGAHQTILANNNDNIENISIEDIIRR